MFFNSSYVCGSLLLGGTHEIVNKMMSLEIIFVIY